MSDWTLNEEQAKQILSTPRTIVKETGVSNDLFLSEEERIKQAKEVLETWKKSRKE